MRALIRLIASDLAALLWDGLVLAGLLQSPGLHEEYWRRMHARHVEAVARDRLRDQR